MYFLFNLSHYVKSCGHFCQILSAHQIWSYHVTEEANFENVLFCPNSTFNIRKNHKISSGKALYFRSYQPKNLKGNGKHSPPPPVHLGLKWSISLDTANRSQIFIVLEAHCLKFSRTDQTIKNCKISSVSGMVTKLSNQ